MTDKPPLLDFIQSRERLGNLIFTHYDDFPYIVGQKVRGTWVDYTGRTYYTEGKIVHNEETGFWVETKDGGITPVMAFWTMYFITDDL